MTQPRNLQKIILPKLLNFVNSSTSATTSLFMIVFLNYRGITSDKIGIVQAISPFLSCFIAPAFAATADVSRRHTPLWVASVALSSAAVLSTIWASSYHIVILCVVIGLHAVFASAARPFLDSTVLLISGSNKYGRQRLFGSLGWGVTALAMGFLTENLGPYSCFVGHVALSVALIAVVITSRKLVQTSQQQQQQGEVGPTIRLSFITSVKLMVFQWRTLVLLLRLFITGLCQSQISFLFLMLHDRWNVEKQLIGIYGLSVVASISLETPTFFFGEQLAKFLGCEMMMVISHVSFAVRVFLYTLIQNPWLVLPIELLHGPFFGCFWTATMQTVAKVTPPGVEATAQGMLALAYTGIGYGVGMIVGGRIFKAFGPIVLYRWVAIVMAGFALPSAIIAAVITILEWRKNKEEEETNIELLRQPFTGEETNQEQDPK